MSEFSPQVGGPIDPVGKKALVLTHVRRTWMQAKDWRNVTASVLFLLYVGVIAWPTLKALPTVGWIPLAGAAATVVFKAWRLSGISSSGIQVVVFGYRERKARLNRLIESLTARAAAPTPEERDAFARDVLLLVASYVRGHRGDTSETKIFVNLMVEDGDDLVVLHRNHAHRVPMARYPKAKMLAWRAIESGNVIVVGDLREHPELSVGDTPKPYRAIMVLPIHGDGRVLGALSVDSSLPHHFDLEWRDLERYLQPYVSLLRWTMSNPRPNLSGRHDE